MGVMTVARLYTQRVYNPIFSYYNDHMIFVWDSSKNQANRKKHGVSFEEAETVFYDKFARLIADPDHSEDEERFVLLGISSELKLLIVVHVYKENDETIRIISARKATKLEQKNTKGDS
jgi:uncharacterized DUF497 family protein